MTQNFIDAHPYRGAFVGYRLARLVDLIAAQGNDLLAADGVSIRSTACSTLLLMSEVQQLTIADISKRLEQPHQLVDQRVKSLIKQGFIERRTDPSDARRKILVLTDSGQSEALALRSSLQRAARAMEQLSDELGFDLQRCADLAQDQLRTRPLAARAEAVQSITEGKQ